MGKTIVVSRPFLDTPHQNIPPATCFTEAKYVSLCSSTACPTPAGSPVENLIVPQTIVWQKKEKRKTFPYSVHCSYKLIKL